MKARAPYNNNAHIGGDDGGFSLVELLIALTILAIGLLAIAHMQILSIQGSAAARRFSTATDIAQREVEELKGPGPMLYFISGLAASDAYMNRIDELYDVSGSNNSDEAFSPSVDINTDIDGVLYDSMKVYARFDTSEPICGAVIYPNKCAYGPMDYVVYLNVRNIPNNVDNFADDVPNGNTTIKEIKVYVLWQDEGMTHHVAVRTLLGRDDSDVW